MSNAWDIRTDDIRQANTRPVFIIVCEDEVSEPVYFKSFQTDKIEVNVVRGNKSSTENILRAIAHCVETGIMLHNVDGKASLNKEDVQIWCVFDRDVDDNPATQQLAIVKFNAALNLALESGIQVAWSNDAFELWILLHFEDIDPMAVASRNRRTYYDRLNEILRSLGNPNEYLTKALAHATFDYSKDLKKERNFINIMQPLIMQKAALNAAVLRAKALVTFHQQQAKPPHEQVPCTMVHLLVGELLRLGGKVLQ